MFASAGYNWTIDYYAAIRKDTRLTLAVPQSPFNFLQSTNTKSFIGNTFIPSFVAPAKLVADCRKSPLLRVRVCATGFTADQRVNGEYKWVLVSGNETAYLHVSNNFTILYERNLNV